MDCQDSMLYFFKIFLNSKHAPRIREYLDFPSAFVSNLRSIIFESCRFFLSAKSSHDPVLLSFFDCIHTTIHFY